MNIHPIFVHFPIALFTLYSIFELIRFKKLLRQEYWFYIKASFVIIGTAVGYVTAFTGDMAKDSIAKLVGPGTTLSDVISLHESFALITLALYTLIAIGYFYEWLERAQAERWERLQSFAAMRFWQQYTRVVRGTKAALFLSLFGLVCVFMTGTLGGIIVYGSGADPIAGVVYRLFFQ
jgi:uncharacterized membrane protein